MMKRIKWFLLEICLYAFIARMITRIKTIFMYSYTVTYWEDGKKKRKREWSHHPFTVWLVSIGIMTTLTLSLIISFLASYLSAR